MSTNKLNELRNYIDPSDEGSDSSMDTDSKNKHKQVQDTISIPKKTRLKFSGVLAATTILAILLFGIYGTRTTIRAWPKINNQGLSLVKKIQNVLKEIRNDQNLRQSLSDLDTTVQSFKQSLEPIDNLFWPVHPAQSITDETISLFKDWVEASKYILQFDFSNQGFVSDLPKNFTDYLEQFFEQLPDLNERTENLINKINFWLFFVPEFDTRVKDLKNSLKLAVEIVQISREIYRNKSQILNFLGADKVHKILIFNQNLGEARPTGGFIGSYISVNINKGRLDIGPSQSIYFADNSKLKPMLAFPAAWYYGHEYGIVDEHGVRNLNFFPCFPTTAKMIEREFSSLPNGQSADTVVFLTTNLIRALFTEKTELKVTEPTDDDNKTGKTFLLTKANFYDQIERLTALELANPENPKAAISPILIALLSNLSSILKDQDPINLAISILNLGATRDLQLWSKGGEINKLWGRFNLDGAQACQNPSDQVGKLAFMMGNISADKRDILANHSFRITTQDNKKFTLNYRRYYSNLKELQRRLNTVDSLTFIAFQLPAQAENYSIKSNYSLVLPFQREFYKVDIKNKTKLDAYIPPEIETVLSSSINLPDKSFKYQQPDGSIVIGLYIAEQEKLEVNLEFDLNSSSFNFYPSPGAAQTEISVNDKLRLTDTLNWKGEYSGIANVSGQAVGVTANYPSIWNYVNCSWYGCYDPNRKLFI
ncbi:MAG: hypothetical protein OHK0017_04190 [Patescibacteria group bacterium]